MTRVGSKTNSMSELTSLKQWVCWKRGETKPNGRFEKKPCIADFPPYSIDAQDPGYHMSYEDALWATNGPFDFGIEGIGFVPTKDDPFCFLDLDDCIDRPADWCADWAANIIEELDSFMYLSPSCTGLRIVLKGELAHGGGHYLYQDEAGDHHIEAYDSNQFLTFTHYVDDSPIKEAQEWLNKLTKVRATSRRRTSGPRIDLGSKNDVCEISLSEGLAETKKEVQNVLVAHELNPEPIEEGLRKVTLISIGARLLHQGRTEDWWREFLPKLNATLLYNKKGELEGLDDSELEEVISENLKLNPKVSPKEVQLHLDTVSEFLTLIRPRMKRAYNTDWNFLKALEIQGRKYGSVVSNEEIRIDGSWLTLQGLSRIASTKTLFNKISRLKEGEILETGKDKKSRAGHFILDVDRLLTGQYFNLSKVEIESMRKDSKATTLNNIHNNHYFTILTHPFWTKQYGNARGPLFAAIASLGGEGRTGKIALQMGRVDSRGKPNGSSISGLLRQCEKEGTLKNPHWGYWHFSEDFEVAFHRAREDAGEFVRDSNFDDYKKDKREDHREKLREYLEKEGDRRKLFNKVVTELKAVNPKLATILELGGASKPMTILDKYFVDGKKVTGVIDEEHGSQI